MYQGNNPTALRSQQWLAESLVALMKEKPYAKITIKDIYQRADLSRQTFYNVFENKDETLRFYLDMLQRPLFLALKDQQDATMQDMIELFTVLLEKNKELVFILIDNHLETIMVEKCVDVIQSLSAYFSKTNPHTAAMPYLTALLSGAIVNVIIYWVREGMNISVHELNEIIQEFIARELARLT